MAKRQRVSWDSFSDLGGSERVSDRPSQANKLPVTGVFQTRFLCAIPTTTTTLSPLSLFLAPSFHSFLSQVSLPRSFDRIVPSCGSLELWNDSSSVPKCEGRKDDDGEKKGREKREERGRATRRTEMKLRTRRRERESGGHAYRTRLCKPESEMKEE